MTFVRLPVAGIAAEVTAKRRSVESVAAETLGRVAAYEVVQPAVWIERVPRSEVLAAARERLAFGPQTWPHALARVMLAEQIYRAASLMARLPYHRD